MAKEEEKKRLSSSRLLLRFNALKGYFSSADAAVGLQGGTKAVAGFVGCIFFPSTSKAQKRGAANLKAELRASSVDPTAKCIERSFKCAAAAAAATQGGGAQRRKKTVEEAFHFRESFHSRAHAKKKFF